MSFRKLSATGPRILNDRSLILHVHQSDCQFMSYEDIFQVAGVYVAGIEGDESIQPAFIPMPNFRRNKQYASQIMVYNEIPQGYRMGVRFPRGAMANDRLARLMTPGFRCKGLRFYVGPICEDDCESYIFIFNDVALTYPTTSSLIGDAGVFGQDTEMYSPDVELLVSLKREPLRRLGEVPTHIFSNPYIKCDCTPTCATFYMGVEDGFLYTGDRFNTAPTYIDLSDTLDGATPIYTVQVGKYLYTIADDGGDRDMYRVLNDRAASVASVVADPRFVHQDKLKAWWIFGDGPQIARGLSIEDVALLSTDIIGETINTFTYNDESNEYYLGCESGNLIRVRNNKVEIVYTFASAVNSLLFLYGNIIVAGLNSGELWEMRECGGDPKYLFAFSAPIVNMIGEFERHAIALANGEVYIRDLLNGHFALFNTFNDVPLMSYCVDDSVGYTGLNNILFIDGQDVSQATPCKI